MRLSENAHLPLGRGVRAELLTPRHPPLGGCVAMGHPGQILQSGMRAGIQNDLISRDLSGFPFDFAQGGEPVEPRVSPGMTVLSNDETGYRRGRQGGRGCGLVKIIVG
jgi:hypothetical protein